MSATTQDVVDAIEQLETSLSTIPGTVSTISAEVGEVSTELTALSTSITTVGYLLGALLVLEVARLVAGLAGRRWP